MNPGQEVENLFHIHAISLLSIPESKNALFSGVLFPYYDHDTRMVYVAGKGDGNVRFYEILDEAPWAFYLNQFISGSPQRGLGVLPKRGCDTARCEIFRFYKLHATKDFVEPIAMIVPRKSEMFQDDIYPETAAPTPSLTGEKIPPAALPWF